MKILVTGGAGYIGSHACKALARAGFTPVAYDNLYRGFARAVKWGPLETGDLLDAARLDAVMDAHRPDAVMHFAALTYVGESVSDPAMYYRANVMGSIALLDAMRRHNVRRIVFSSTAAVYGEPPVSPIPESSPLAPINPYGQTKLGIERAIGDYAKAYGYQWAALRYFNAAGADPDGEIGENHDPETHLIPLAVQAALGQRGALSVFGDDYPTPDGSAVRDYIHVTDLAEAHVAALRRLLDDQSIGALNLGTGRGRSVLEICAAVERVTGRTLPLTRAPRRAGDPPVLVADASRARDALGWTARLDDIDAIVAHTAAWLSKPLSERT